jgi:alpha-N-acetylglucosamine transferase
MIYKYKILTFLVCIVFLFYQFNEFDHTIFKNKRSKLKKIYLESCSNKVKFENEISVWTLLTDNLNYAKSAVKLLKSIELNSKELKFDKVILELKEKKLNPELRHLLVNKSGWKICQVNKISARDEQNTFARFRDQFTKLILWNMTEYKSVVYFDSDTFVINNIVSLLEVYKRINNTYKIAVTKDIRGGKWMNTFNMGVFSIKPNRSEFNRLIQLKSDKNLKFETKMSEQGFLNVVYKNKWFDFGFENNANLAVYSQKRKFWDENESKINVIHYTMNKPWDCSARYIKICDKWKNFD